MERGNGRTRILKDFFGDKLAKLKRINSQSLEDTQVGYISQKYTLDKHILEKIHKDGVRGEKICHVEKFQISEHDR